MEPRPWTPPLRGPTSPLTTVADPPCPKRTPRKSGGTSQRGLGNAGGRSGVTAFQGGEMKVMLTRLGAAVLGCAAAIVCSAAVANADPADPHQPDLPKNFCPGGQWGVGRLRVCDGEKYPDGSYWHQWMGGNGWVGPTWNYDCVGDSGNSTFPAPPPPGGCNGAIPPEPPAPPAAPAT
jgi:hypothetical protein